MNSINLPSAVIPQSPGAAASPSGLPLDLAMLDSAVPEEMFAAMLAGQLQGLSLMTGEVVEEAGPVASEEGLLPAAAPDLAALLQVPQDVAAMVSASLQQPSAQASATDLPAEDAASLSVLAATATTVSDESMPADDLSQGGDQGASDSADSSIFARQALAASAAAFATPVVPVPAQTNVAAQSRSEELVMPAVASQVGSSNTAPPLNVLAATQPEGSMSFALPQMQQVAPPGAAAAASVPQTSIPQQVGSQAWGGMVGERVVWMFGQQHQSADIMLNPPSLGPLEVRLTMSDGQANLTFTTQHAPVREALEAATPRLREMLTESGISLGNVSVNVGNFSRQDPQAQQQAAERQSPGWAEDKVMHDFTVLSTDLPSRRGNGLLDLFA